jgi:sugar O-acyltransferase (sialic acid O-acetyltransferase NeuD family)
MKKIIIIGAGGHAKSCIDVIERSKKFKIIGLYATKKELGNKLFRYNVIGCTLEDLRKIRKKTKYAFIAIGQIKSSNIRRKYYKKLKKMQFEFPSVISPLSYVSKHSRIGIGSIVMHGVKINAASKIGNFCIINSNALIEHDNIINNFSHISTSVILNGGVEVGSDTFIGSRSTIANGVKIGDKCIISMTSQVFKNVKENQVYKKK